MEENKNSEKPVQANEQKSDAAKLAEKHLNDPNHIITEEDMREIKVGVVHDKDAPTKEALKDAEEKVADRKADSEQDTLPGGQKITPWDTINP